MQYILLIAAVLGLEWKKTFPFSIIFLLTNFLEFSYGIKTNLISFGFGSILVFDILFLIVLYNIIKHKNIIIKYEWFNSLTFIFLILFTIGIIQSIFFTSFSLNVFIRIYRVIFQYLIFQYLFLELLRKNMFKYFNDVVLILFYFAFIIQIMEVISQSRIIIPFISNPDNRYFNEGAFLYFPGLGRVLYSWNRFLKFLPYTFIIIANRYKSNPYKLTILFIMWILSYVLGLGRASISVAVIIITTYYIIAIRKKLSLTNQISIILMIIAISVGLYQYIPNNVYEIGLARVNSVSEMRKGESSTLKGRMEMFAAQKELIKSKPIAGGGFSEKYFNVLTGDLALSNIVVIFGFIGLIYPIYIVVQLIRSSYYLKNIYPGNYSILSVTLGLLFGALFTQDYFFFGNATLIPIIASVSYLMVNRRGNIEF